MNDPMVFEVLPEHVALLRRAYVDWDGGEYGAPAINCKRPYGNSSVASDIAEILGWPVDEEDGPSRVQRERARDLHDGTRIALQIFLVTGAMEPGRYVKRDPYATRSWERVP